MKSNKILVIISIVLLVVFLSIYIIYGNLNQRKESNNQKNNPSENNISKLDNNKEWTYDADYNLPTDKESYYGGSDHSKQISASDLIVPYVNIDSPDAKKTNQEIYKIYQKLIDTFNNNLQQEILYTLVEYKTYINDNILSLVITTESAGTDVPSYEYYTYNFNLTDGSLLTYEETYQKVGFTKDTIEEKTKQAITTAMNKEYSNKADFDTYNDKSINNYKTSVDNNTIQYFLDQNNDLNIIVTLTIPAGRGQFNKVISIK